MLVAVSIPIFTTQLEKSREATDVANIRDFYAEIAADLLTGDLDKDHTTVTLSGGKTATYTDGTTNYTVTVADIDVSQTRNEWQSGNQDVAGCTIAASTNMVGMSNIVFTFTVPATGSAYLSSITFS